MRSRLLALVAGLLVLNLAIMALDVMLLPEQGGLQVAPVSPAPSLQVRPQRTTPNQLDQFLRGLGVRPIGTERLQIDARPDLRPGPSEPRSAPPGRPQPSLRPFSLHQSGLGGMFMHVVALLATFCVSAVLAYLMPNRLRVMRNMLGGPWSHKLRMFVIGAISYLAAILLASLLAALVSGLIYAVLAVAVLTGLTALGITSVALAVGRWLTARAGAPDMPLAQLLVGLMLIFPLTILPYFLGWAAAGIAASFGMGAILLTRMGGGTPWSLEALR